MEILFSPELLETDIYYKGATPPPYPYLVGVHVLTTKSGLKSVGVHLKESRNKSTRIGDINLTGVDFEKYDQIIADRLQDFDLPKSRQSMTFIWSS